MLVPPALALCAALGALVSDPTNGLRTLLDLREQASEARERVGELEREKLQLATLVRQLQHDPERVEAAARARLGMVRPGEVVVRMPRRE